MQRRVTRAIPHNLPLNEPIGKQRSSFCACSLREAIGCNPGQLCAIGDGKLVHEKSFESESNIVKIISCY